jgi:hypothetical protein
MPKPSGWRPELFGLRRDIAILTGCESESIDDLLL